MGWAPSDLGVRKPDLAWVALLIDHVKGMGAPAWWSAGGVTSGFPCTGISRWRNGRSNILSCRMSTFL